jgi:hypothetical protein
MTRLFSILALVTFVLVLGLMGAQSASRDTPLVDEEYAVYDATISSLFEGGKVTFDSGAEVRHLVIRELTVADDIEPGLLADDGTRLRQGLATLTTSTVDDYKEKNKTARRLERAFDLSIPYVLVEDQSLEALLAGDRGRGWRVFYEQHPDSGGVVGLSRVGFNNDRTQALVFVQHQCGDTCASGNYVLLTMVDGRYRVLSRMQAWIS